MGVGPRGPGGALTELCSTVTRGEISVSADTALNLVAIGMRASGTFGALTLLSARPALCLPYWCWGEHKSPLTTLG